VSGNFDRSISAHMLCHNKHCSTVAAPIFVTLSHLSVSKLSMDTYTGYSVSHVLNFRNLVIDPVVM